MTASMDRLMTVTASTKRAALSGADYGDPVTHLTGIACTPVDPVPLSEQSDLPTRSTLGAPVRYYQTVTAGNLDIQAGDILSADGVNYYVRRHEPWAASSLGNGDAYQKLTLEKVKP